MKSSPSSMFNTYTQLNHAEDHLKLDHERLRPSDPLGKRVAHALAINALQVQRLLETGDRDCATLAAQLLNCGTVHPLRGDLGRNSLVRCFCNSRFCLSCGTRSFKARKVMLEAAVMKQIQRGQAIGMITLTIPHSSDDSPAELLTQITAHWSALRRMQAWKKYSPSHFVKILECVLGGMNGAHWHIHLLVFYLDRDHMNNGFDRVKSAWMELAGASAEGQDARDLSDDHEHALREAVYLGKQPYTAEGFPSFLQAMPMCQIPSLVAEDKGKRFFQTSLKFRKEFMGEDSDLVEQEMQLTKKVRKRGKRSAWRSLPWRTMDEIARWHHKGQLEDQELSRALAQVFYLYKDCLKRGDFEQARRVRSWWGRKVPELVRFQEGWLWDVEANFYDNDPTSALRYGLFRGVDARLGIRR